MWLKEKKELTTQEHWNSLDEKVKNSGRSTTIP